MTSVIAAFDEALRMPIDNHGAREAELALTGIAVCDALEMAPDDADEWRRIAGEAEQRAEDFREAVVWRITQVDEWRVRARRAERLLATATEQLRYIAYEYEVPNSQGSLMVRRARWALVEIDLDLTEGAT
tara:strand:+ start:2088 stop:2480 length:393 start_codon:yes stop_codon:yes gene_type:complete